MIQVKFSPDYTEADMRTFSTKEDIIEEIKRCGGIYPLSVVFGCPRDQDEFDEEEYIKVVGLDQQAIHLISELGKWDEQKEPSTTIGWAEDNGNGETGPIVKEWNIVFSRID